MIGWLDWLLNGSDDLTMPKTWLANHDRLRAYAHYTRRQRFQGVIMRTPEELQAENERIVAEREQRLALMQPSNVLHPVIRQFGRGRA